MAVRVEERFSYFLGLDVGKVNDPAAVCVLERRHRYFAGPYDPVDPTAHAPEVRYSVRHLERLPLGTSYPAVADRIGAIAAKLRQRPAGIAGSVRLSDVIVDVTGVGRPVLDLLQQRALGATLTGVNFTGGQRASSSESGVWNVPKADLVSNLVVMFQAGELLIAEALPEAPVLVRELVNFRRFVSDSGRASYGNDGTEAKHDDYVSAAALAAWKARVRAAGPQGQRLF